MRILVVGKGGREHALLTALDESATPAELFCHPGSDAIFSTVARPATGVSDVATLVDFAKRENIDVVVAGEESYLVAGPGLANLCARAGIPCWGPPRESAQLEASKEFAKRFLARHRIPTAAYSTAGSFAEARSGLRQFPVVLKFDGLAAGKGVAVCQSAAEAEAFLESVFVHRQFGDGRVVIEECLQGPEISIFASVVDGGCHVLCPARDYKRIFAGDRGPNTGGMGAVASSALVSASLLGEIERTIVVPTVAGLKSDGLPYRGFLYFGLMLTEDGPKVLEYNCRFGDPECEAVMSLMSGDLVQYVWHGARGELRPDLLRFDDGWSACIILASAGYPESSRSGDVISGLEAIRDARVFHCGTRRHAAGHFETNGGRVLAVVARAPTRLEAVQKASTEAEKIDFAGRQRRRDIGVLHFE